MKVKFYTLFTIALFLSAEILSMELNPASTKKCQVNEVLLYKTEKEMEALEKIQETLLKIEETRNKPGLTLNLLYTNHYLLLFPSSIQDNASTKVISEKPRRNLPIIIRTIYFADKGSKSCNSCNARVYFSS